MADVIVLYSRLGNFAKRRFEFAADLDSFEALLRELQNGCRSICSYAAAYNAQAKLQVSLVDCLKACLRIVASMTGDRWDIMQNVCDSSGDFIEHQFLVQMITIVLLVSRINP